MPSPLHKREASLLDFLATVQSGLFIETFVRAFRVSLHQALGLVAWF